MPFVRRNADGYIDAVYEIPEGDAQEELVADDPEVIEFLGLDAESIAQTDEWLRSDLALARVTEDLINTMIEKGLIAFTDLPTGAQEKLIQRSNLRSELSYVASLFTSEDDEFI